MGCGNVTSHFLCQLTLRYRNGNVTTSPQHKHPTRGRITTTRPQSQVPNQSDYNEDTNEDTTQYDFEYNDAEDESQDDATVDVNPFGFDSDDNTQEEVILAPTNSSPTTKTHSWLYRSQYAPLESEREFQFLQSFLELGGGRSIQYISQILNIQESTIYKIYCKNNWKLRAADYDRYMLSQKIKLSQDARQQEHLMQLERYRQEQEAIGRQLSMNAAKIAQLANATLNTMLDNAENITVRDMPSMLNAAAKLADIGKQLQSTALGVDQLLVALEESEVE
jgi:hypothetical protein